ncbi:hypothetical protein HU200_038965 [Digitaria exilis]|uniref:Fe2OG dioxygenase domain-containing protein n=1 Tax=Digitaria exilis TaxID=1010633 RepID=A0A835BD48_9POAL|nr:hypothetical protein HU200_038965 [Digitaria exilis]
MAASDRLRQLKAFDDTKAGVKGLVDAGVDAVPPIFHHPPLDPHHHTAAASCDDDAIPVVDLQVQDDDRQEVVAQVRAAAETVGFFQVVNHGVPGDLLAETLASVRRFHEQPAEARRPYYTRDPARRVRYQSNFDLFQSPAANWRDTLFLETPALTPEEEIPPTCRAAVPEYARRVGELGARLLGLLSEALGLHAACLPGYLDDGGGGPVVGCHYYPPCPEPSLTLGTSRHSDPSFLTVLLQDDVGGLQVLIDERWVDVHPVPGALVVNVGDLLQLVSNDRFKSVEPPCGGWRRRAGRRRRPPGPMGPSPPRITVAEFLGHYKNKGLDGTSALARFRLPVGAAAADGSPSSSNA